VGPVAFKRTNDPAGSGRNGLVRACQAAALQAA